MRLLLFVVLLCSATFATAQTREEVMTNRAREFHRVISQDDPAVWKQYVIANYTKALIAKQMRQQVSNDGGKTTTVSEGDALEAKVKMLSRLHDDFGGGKIVSLKPSGDDIEMVASSPHDMQGKFKFKFEKTSPYLIDGVSIEIGD
jgi:hypothetical protein